MDIMLHSLNIAGSEWLIILLAIVIILVPSKISGISKTIGKFIGEYEKAKDNLINEKNNLVQHTTVAQKQYIGPTIQRPVSSEREKLEIIAKSLHIDTEKKSDYEIRNLISSKLKGTQT
ncbi:MAG: twin-arginine translocase TatA/TatE family subunit [Nitrosopumilus sp.]|nr:twin-arginine translocase TatA/TatE family subunit [Nitrosopumilus sp.]